MASSPLTLAMLGGGAGLGGIQDPAYLPASRHLALAQNLIGQGLDGSPTPWTGALARVLMAGLGAHELNAGESEFADVTGQRQHAALDAINYMRGDGASPLASAITGPAPTMQPAPPAAQPSAPGAAPTPPPALAAATHQLESGGSMAPGVTGDGGAAGGVMQVHQGALTDVNHALGTNYTMDQVTADPAIGKKVGDAYLGLQYARFPGHPELALAAYNAGPTATANAVSNGTGLAGLPQSTQAYVTKGIQLAGGDAGAPALPQGGGAPPTGLQAPNVARAMQMMQRAQEMAAANPYNSAIQEAARMQIQQAQVIAGLDQFAPGPNGTQVNTRTGEVKYPPIGRVATDSAGNVIAVDSSGSHIVSPTDPEGAGKLAGAKAGAEAAAKDQWVPAVQNGLPGQQNKVTGEFKPTVTAAPRFAQTPSGDVLIGKPGGTVEMAVPANNPGVAARAAANSQGTATGTQASTTADKMFDLGRESGQALGNIDYGLNQLHEAQKGGINPGYFAPWLATAAAAGKSLGVDLSRLGIDPAAVGNVQSAQKTLGVVAGTILQNTIGKDSQITDAKIDHFIHTQPGIETDPQAIERIMNWARSQFVYNHDMAMDAMQHIDPNTGMLPPGWRASFVTKKASFAPIYDPLSGEMKQPAGEGPPAEAPKPPVAAPAATAPAQPAAAPPPVAGARQAPDGNWYLPDPKRPGKYLQVQ